MASFPPPPPLQQQQRVATLPHQRPSQPPPQPPGPPPAADSYEQDQEKKIMAQEVSQAIHHLVHTYKPREPEESVAARAPEKADSGPNRPVNRRGRQEEYFTRAGATPEDAPIDYGKFKVEFTPAYLNFIPELSVLLLSCLLPVLAICGKHVLTTLLVGILATYMFDYTNSKKMALASVWMCIMGVWLGLYYTNVHLLLVSWLNVFLLLNATFYLFLLGVFATAQFKWLQLQNPELALAGERILLGLTPIVCLPLLFSTLISLIGSDTAPFFFVAVCCILHKVFYQLRRSCFKAALSPDARCEEYINGIVEAGLFTVMCICLPLFLQVIINHKEPLTILSLLNAATLIGGPILYLFYDPRNSLWFLYRNPYGDRGTSDDIFQLKTMRSLVLLISYLAVLHWLIYRVVFGRFAYILAGVPPPLNVICIAIASYSASIGLYWAIDLVERPSTDASRAVRWCGILIFSIAGAVAFCLAAGMPRFMICTAALGAACFTSFCLDPRNINNYLVFACVTFIMLTWWMYKSFSFLVIDLPILGGTETVSLPQLSVYILWLYLIQCLVFPLGLNQETSMFYISLLQQAAALNMIEHILYSQPENLYPWYCVVGTTLWGLYFTDTMRKNKKLRNEQCAVLAGLYVAKVYLFCMVVTLPEPGTELYVHAFSQSSLIATFFAVGIMSATVMLLYFEWQQRKRRSRVTTLATLYAICAFSVAYTSRNSIVLGLLEITTGNSDVEVGRKLGLTLLFAGMLQVPLAAILPVSQGRPKRVCSAFILVGTIIALIDPIIESPEVTDEMEMELYEAPWWSSGLGIISIAAVGATLLNVFTLPDNTGARIAWWTLISLGCGMSFAGLFIPFATWHAYLLVSLVIGLTVLCIDFTHYSVSAQKDDSNTVWGLYTGAIVTLLASLLDAQWRVPEEFDRNLQFETATQRQNAILSLSIGINVLLAALIKLKLTDRPVLMPRNIAKVDSMRESQGDGVLFGLLGNICIVQAYVMLLFLRSDFGNSGPGFPVLLSPLLLLMHDDGWMLSGLADPEQLVRYVPAIAASLIALVWHACWVEFPAVLSRSPVYFAMQLTIFMLASAIGCSATHDLWIDSKRRRKEGSADTFIIVIGIVLFLFAGLESVRLTVAVSLVACVLPLFNDSAWARKWSAVL